MSGQRQSEALGGDGLDALICTLSVWFSCFCEVRQVTGLGALEHSLFRYCMKQRILFTGVTVFWPEGSVIM